ncbi:hypothetical protein JCM8202v2_005283 [Rhodotorula sphaerocarpa]
MAAYATTAVAPITIHGSASRPQILLSSPPSTSSSPVPPPPSPASMPKIAPALSRRAVFDLRSSSPLSPSAAEKTLLRAQLERAKSNRVLLRYGKKARPLSHRELRRIAAEEGADTSQSGTGGPSTGSNTPLSLSDSDRHSGTGVMDSIDGLLSGEEGGSRTATTSRERADTRIGGFFARSKSSGLAPSFSSSSLATAVPESLVSDCARYPSISPSAPISPILSRRPSVKVDLSTAFGDLAVRSPAATTPEGSAAKQALGKTRSLPSPGGRLSAAVTAAGSATSRRSSVPHLYPLTVPTGSPSGLASPITPGRRRQLSAGGSIASGARSPVSPPKQSVMSTHTRDLKLEFTRRRRPELGQRAVSASSVQMARYWSGRSPSQAGAEESCELTEPDESEPSDGEGTTPKPFFEPSIFASPSSRSEAVALVSSVPPRNSLPSSSLSYWSIHSSASSSHARSNTSSTLASSTAGSAETGSLRSKLASPSATGQGAVPSGLVQAVPLSPVVPFDEAAWPGALPALPTLPAVPSHLSLAHPARSHARKASLPVDPKDMIPIKAVSVPAKPLSEKKVLPNGVGGGGGGGGLDLRQLRREQLARRRAAVDLELSEGEDSVAHSPSGADDHRTRVFRSAVAPEGARVGLDGGGKESSWEDEREHVSASGLDGPDVGAGKAAAARPDKPHLLRRTST